MTVSNARSTALTVVSRVRERSAYAHETLAAVLAKAGLDERDSAFAARLALGTIAHRGVLDELVARHLRGDVRLEPLVADALATSAYELLHMRTPVRAAVYEGVELVRRVQPRAAGLANAVLRRLGEEAPSFPGGDPGIDNEALARATGHPLWMVENFLAEHGRTTATAMLQANDEPAPLFVALATSDSATMSALTEAGADPAPGPFPGCFVLQNASAAIHSGVLKKPGVLVVDAGAQLAAASVPLPAEGIVVELGAGRGTKTLLMARRAAEAGLDCTLLAVDVHGFKLDALQSAAEQMGLHSIRTLAADATNPDSEGLPCPGSVDSVLVDAPCSGLGTLRRHPDRRWRATADELPALAALGSRLLSTAAALVKPGGFVVYSTCTVTKTENDDVVLAFLASAEGTGFTTVPLTPKETGPFSRFVGENGWFRSLPEPEGPDGHFIARLVRKD